MEHEDHRMLANRLDLYHMEENAPGMIYWHPAGWRIYRALEDYIRGCMRALDYEEVRSPQLLPRELWEKSGHWEKFGENMFAVPRPEGRELALKPMSCPCHLQIFNAGHRSWRDLPARYAEFGICHRDEPSGSMHGLMRSRGFEQDDAHVICRPEQVVPEVARFVGLLKKVYADLGFPDFDVMLSLRPEKRAGSEEDWDAAEAQLLDAARAAGLDPALLPGEGAFYGPKLEFALRDLQGRSWQCGTIQLDMVLPGRLEANYIGENGARHVPVMLHHAVLGSMGRFIGILLEHHRGRLPLWLAPEQVAVLPISEEQRPAAEAAYTAMRDAGLRPVMLDQAETLQRRLLIAHERLIPVHAVIGRREAAAGQIMLQDGNAKRAVALRDGVLHLKSAGSAP
ncbi:threonine--tRNA ligase [Mesobaculum littorinae]|uniref:Threonine--tRNA ligase n=1 Tax=Mesobaculum littorinae TaxID=2486419 RepID=A0A438AL73_9RHOB|nr:threonine--tRNA ligase [Mesobaculum littorinae]